MGNARASKRLSVNSKIVILKSDCEVFVPNKSS
jgi:hypothetical protein